MTWCSLTLAEEGLFALLGAVIGAAIAAKITRGIHREHQTLEILRIYQQNFGRYSHALYYLQDWLKDGSQPTEEQINEVRSIGNWFEIFAALIVNRRIDSRIIEEIGLKRQILSFWEKVQQDNKIYEALHADRWRHIRRLDGGRKWTTSRFGLKG